MVVSITGQILALSSLVIIGLLINRFIKLELTLACLLTGFIAGLGLGYVDFDTGIRAYNLQDIVFFIILPILIFEAAWHIKPALLKKWLLPILIMATLGVLISAAITACLVYFGINHPSGFPWMAAFITGAIVAATDPAAVISQLRTIKAPKDLSTLFEGESLFNDATVIVLFSIFISIATQSVSAESNYFSFFAMVFFGGVVFGIVTGLITTVAVLLIKSSIASRFLLVFSAFASFYIAEHLLHVSGIMAVMLTALITRFSLKEVEDTVGAGINETWEWLGLFLNGLLFAIMGLVITVDMFVSQWLAMLIAIIAALLSRAIAIGSCSFLTKAFGIGLSRGWQIILVWGGLRGAIAIALVLSLPTTLPYWWTIQSMVFGVVLFSILVQGTTNMFVLRKFS